MKISIIYYAYRMNIKTILVEEYVNFVDKTKKQNKYFEILIILFVVTLCLFLFYYLNEEDFFSTTKNQN